MLKYGLNPFAEAEADLALESISHRPNATTTAGFTTTTVEPYVNVPGAEKIVRTMFKKRETM